MKNVLRESQRRIRTMALIHERLYQSKDFNRIDFRDYLSRMILHLFSSFDISAGQVQTQLDVNDIYLNINTAIPCGLLINELVSNALKYAFPNNRKGRIFISMIPGEDSSIRLRFGDDGIGLPPDLDFKNTQTLGLQLVNDLVKQIKGSVRMEKGRGTVFDIRFSA